MYIYICIYTYAYIYIPADNPLKGSFDEARTGRLDTWCMEAPATDETDTDDLVDDDDV
jgi:hypothetical protein